LYLTQKQKICNEETTLNKKRDPPKKKKKEAKYNSGKKKKQLNNKQKKNSKNKNLDLGSKISNPKKKDTHYLRNIIEETSSPKPNL
jgi:hypothetical protein